jgi:choline monooxygenase
MGGLEWSHAHSVDIEANWKNYADNYMEGYHIPLVHPELNRQVDARRYQVLVGDRYCNHVAPARDGAIAAGKWLWRFPTLALGIYGDGMEIERFLPLGPHRTRVTYDFFFTPGTPEQERHDVTRVAVDVLEEDKRICEAVQRNLDSGAYDVGRLSPRHENGVWYLQKLIVQALD